MRLNNDRDQACVRAAMPEGARGFLDAIPALRNRECIVCGEGVAIPIRVRFDDLEPEKRPASSDPSFARLWRETGDEEGIINRTDQALARPRPLSTNPGLEPGAAGASRRLKADRDRHDECQPRFIPTLSKAFSRAFTALTSPVSATGALEKRTPSGLTGVPPCWTS